MGTLAEARRALARAGAWLLGLQLRRPWWPIAVTLILAAAGGVEARRLELKTRFENLLPERQPSVVELARLQVHTTTDQNVFIVLEGSDAVTLRALGDALVPVLRGVGTPWVHSAEDGVQAVRAFLQPRSLLFLGLPELRSLRDDVDARWDWEVGRQTGSSLDDTAPPIRSQAIRDRLRTSGADRFPDGYFASKDGRTLVVVVRSSVVPGELPLARQALDRIRAAVDGVAKTPPWRSVHIGYAGDLVTGLSEYGEVRDDLLHVGIVGVSAVLAVVVLFFMRLRVLLAMGLTIAVGLTETFGLTRLAIGHLNVATGFLVSIVAGNGINFGIIFMARFYEELRDGASLDAALGTARAATWRPTLTAALAAAASYGSLGVTDFRAFKHFAFIGATGMILCWIATYTLLPAVLVVLERRRPFARVKKGLFAGLRAHGVPYDRPFVWLVRKAPRSIAIASVGLAVAGFAMIGPYLRSDPMEYNMRHLQNDLGGGRDLYRVSAAANEVLGTGLGDAMAVLCDRAVQVPLLKRALEARRDETRWGDRPFDAVGTLGDYVPEDQAVKLPIAMWIRERVLRAHARGFLRDREWSDAESLLPPEDLTPWTAADLPENLARPFTERDGTRGRLVLIEPTAGRSDSDLRYLLKWADSFRETHLSDGSVVRGSGRAVIFADILEAVRHDMPRALFLSLAMTVAAVSLTFGLRVGSVAVLGSLGVALGWIALAVGLAGLKIDFFNFIALPITFGIGVDYAVNVVQRYVAERPRGILAVLRASGGPVVLCSLTTMLGYLALLGSSNRAIRGLGLWAVMGEIACLLSAVLVLPAILWWVERRRASSQRPTMLHATPSVPLIPEPGE
jgi:predicted RND superfamily exporter protein